MILNKYFIIDNIYLYIECNYFFSITNKNIFKFKLLKHLFLYIENYIIYLKYKYLNTYLYDSINNNLNFIFLNFLKNSINYNTEYLKLEGRGNKMYNFLNYLIFKLGYSHLCYFLMPLDIFLIRKSNKLEIKLKSFNKFILNQRLSILQRFKIPNNYKIKGIYIS
jgi:hypothetical protein